MAKKKASDARRASSEERDLLTRRTAMIYPVESCEAGPQSGIQPGRGCSATLQVDFLRSHKVIFHSN